MDGVKKRDAGFFLSFFLPSFPLCSGLKKKQEEKEEEEEVCRRARLPVHVSMYAVFVIHFREGG